MRSLVFSFAMLAVAFGASAARADGPGPVDARLLNAIHEMRIALEQERVQRDAELGAPAEAYDDAAAGFGEQRGEGVDSPGRSEGDVPCIEIDVDVSGGEESKGLRLVCRDLESGAAQRSYTGAHRGRVPEAGAAP
jgi:hypothetical protein